MIDEWVGLVPAAGKGLRLNLPYPKELYPVIRNNHYKPIAQFVLTNLTAAGVKHIVFVVNETKFQLIGYFGNGRRFGGNISYVVQEPLEEPEKSSSPGLAHALDSAYHLVMGKTVFFGMADTIMQPNNVFSQMYTAAQQEDDVLLGLFPTNHPEKFGMVSKGDDNYVKEIVDKPSKTDLVEMWGCMIWRPAFTEFLHACVNDRGIHDFALIMNLAIQQGMRFKGISLPEGVFIDLGTYNEIMQLDRLYREE